MDFWNKARSFAEEAAKRSQELTKEAAKRSQQLTIGSSKFSDIVLETAKRSKEIAAEASKRSQEITIGSSKLSDIVSETAKRSKEIAAEASKRADQIKIEAIKRADQIKSLAEGITPSGHLPRTDSTAEAQQEEKEKELERFGITEELREFVKEITLSTFQDFPLPDDSEISDVPTVSNVRQDLTEWQEKHAKLVLSTVKEISKFRYELCPRSMKERKFWMIYFILVNSHVALYEKRYMEQAAQDSVEYVKGNEVEEPPKATVTSKQEVKKPNQQTKASSLSSADQDLDVFLLGGESDEGPDDSDGTFDDDLDKMVDSSDDEKRKL
ncbi:hypothetical protein JCGZ_11768 [Jatropha curcas]|uniref:BSD domain-containing protein n=1 Tax=Jatropha curcas TaxID=180498 RepID=A0A067K5J4_JATCU|nr:uncharacterized protein LOC105640673 [Jatropha curcas]KDP31392.1 hypothetical protein JCGZ_11768 [Jatropha curcas]